jgi:hypothetical protein
MAVKASFACPQPRRGTSIETWAKAVTADPAAHGATQREAAIIADLLTQAEAGR